GCGHNLGPIYVTYPKLNRNSEGLLEPNDSMYSINCITGNLIWANFYEPLKPYNWANSTDVLLL
ncbi:MAG: hypothetical protein ACI9U1_001960, partial [Porticoccaceae bacterium]